MTGESRGDEVEERAYQPCRMSVPGTGQGRAKPEPGPGPGLGRTGLLGSAGLGSRRRPGVQETKSSSRRRMGGEERRGEERQLAGRKQTKIPQPNPVQPCRSN